MNKKERAHCNLVASLGCMVCGAPAELHHVMMGTGLSQRSDHFMVIPLCGVHHRTGQYGEALHAGLAAFEDRYGTESELLSQVNDQIYPADGDFVRIRDPEFRQTA